jgi:hypothetical protein
MMGVLFGLCDPLAQSNICNLQNRRKADHEVVAPIESRAKADPSSIEPRRPHLADGQTEATPPSPRASETHRVGKGVRGPLALIP